MLCKRPFMLGTLECPCGGCLPCRINRRRVWAHRILLESFKHGDSSFVTLTYSDEHCPSSLVKSDYQLFLKRLRRIVAPRKIRYFLAGEYGAITKRPHFHAAIFGIDPFFAGGLDGQGGVVNEAWGKGFTRVGTLTWSSAQYIAGYLTKKVLPDEFSVREFSRMSLRPGIGSSAMADVATALGSDVGLDAVAFAQDVPATLRHSGKLLPLGRYLRRQLRGYLGFASKDTPSEATRLYVLQKAAQKVEARAQLRKDGLSSWDAENLIVDTRKQKINNFVARFELRDSKRRL